MSTPTAAPAPLVDGLVALLIELGAGPRDRLEAEARQMFLNTRLPGPAEPEGDLTAQDIYRIRMRKFVARQLPPDFYQDLGARRRVGARLRELVVAHLGDAGASRFLDGP